MIQNARMTARFAADGGTALPLHVVTAEQAEGWLATQPKRVRHWAAATGFVAALGSLLLLQDRAGGLAGAVYGLGSERDRRRGRFLLAGARARLPAGTYRLQSGMMGDDLDEAALGWLLAGYRFGRYRKGPDRGMAGLVAPEGIDAVRTEAIAAGEFLTRDLINTPAADLGPSALEAAASDLAATHGATIAVTRGDELLAGNFPMIHAVGRAAADAPRLIDMSWGDQGPSLVLIGKGVCFDTGGLNIKPGSTMTAMKKDMGGAATVLGLAHMIMALQLPLRLRVLIPAVENAIAGNAMRPGDILTARNGLTVEIGNTDAEGRLVLADALVLATTGVPPDLTVSMATLTGAARVALGPDVPPFYASSDRIAAALIKGAATVRDPVWRLPLWAPYEVELEPGIADLHNAPFRSFAGSIMAALFLCRFAGEGPYAHFDIYCHQPKSAPGRPKGGVGQGARAILAALPELLGVG